MRVQNVNLGGATLVGAVSRAYGDDGGSWSQQRAAVGVRVRGCENMGFRENVTLERREKRNNVIIDI